ncbi:hypothetical protein PGTUg99_007835 [Puccinia graminis f. sp. tritici]|uniref:Uncharacterized protein n=1 Tax=Puccinia graminis f. sp. tritici TaxID=56615 RepID=A0A5B0LMF7_PUCGR|nr:hypothetical protein PGTUg99_007835 [Puccinia graminis f. sp. tritici]
MPGSRSGRHCDSQGPIRSSHALCAKRSGTVKPVWTKTHRDDGSHYDGSSAADRSTLSGARRLSEHDQGVPHMHAPISRTSYVCDDLPIESRIVVPNNAFCSLRVLWRKRPMHRLLTRSLSDLGERRPVLRPP